jgi:hypothetical protein
MHVWNVFSSAVGTTCQLGVEISRLLNIASLLHACAPLITTMVRGGWLTNLTSIDLIDKDFTFFVIGKTVHVMVGC